MFDPEALARRGLVTGRAGAGRAGALFFELDGEALVLRRYRRGGLARHLTADRYLSLGPSRSRPVREFELLLALEGLGLPVPRAHAARVTRRGPFESGALVTHRLPGETLAERLATAKAERAERAVPWEAIGRCLARFHAAGAVHADLNAHNLMVAGDPDAPDGASVALIDFDRGRLLPGPVPRRRALASVDRLERSVAKLAAAGGRSPERAGVRALRAAWAETLSDR